MAWLARLMPAFVLRRIVRKDYWLRERGLRQDAWHWADRELLRRGLFVEF